MPNEGHEPVTELSLMKKLLIPAAEVMAMDATDFSDGDRFLKEMGKDVRTYLPRGNVFDFFSALYAGVF